MVRKFMLIAVAGWLAIATTPSLADDILTPATNLMTTVTTDVSKGIATFDPVEILTPKPIDAPAAEPAAKVKKKKRYAKRRMKKMAKK